MSKWMWRPFHLDCKIECFSSVLQVTLRLLSTRLREANDLEQPFVEICPALVFKNASHV